MQTPTAASDRGRFSSVQLAFMIGVPVAWAILLLFHPLDGDTFYDVIDDNVVPWVTVHLGMGVFVPLFAGAVFLLLRGVDGTAATISRIGLAVFAVFYAAWELVLGVGTGVLTHAVNDLPVAQQPVGAELVDAYAESTVIFALSALGSIGLAVGLIGAAVALRRAERVGWPALVLMVVAIPLIALHEPPFGPVGLAMFVVAVLLIARGKATAPVPRAARLEQAAPA